MTSKELAKILGVSQSTVSRSMNDNSLISQQTRERVKAAAEKYGLVLNENAKKLKNNRSGVIGVLMPSRFVDFYKSMSTGDIFNRLKFEFLKHDLEVNAFCFSSKTLNDRVKNLVLAKKVDGLIVIRQQFDDEIKALLYRRKMPFMLLNQLNMDNRDDNCVAVDYYQAGHVVGEYFKQNNRKHALCLSSTDYERVNRLKLCGFMDGLGCNHGEFEKNNVFYEQLSFDGGKDFVANNINKIKASDAVFAVDDSMAIGIINGCAENGILVPQQLAVVGFDGLEVGGWVTPSLSTVSVNNQEMCEYTVKRFLELLSCSEEAPQSKLFKGSLIKRQSGGNEQTTKR